MCGIVVKKFTFAISSPDEFLYDDVMMFSEIKISKFQLLYNMCWAIIQLSGLYSCKPRMTIVSHVQISK